jgi:hypothetical protein
VLYECWIAFEFGVGVTSSAPGDFQFSLLPNSMGLLDKLWDDVLAGPQPDKGLKKLRKERLAAAGGLADVFQDDGDDMSKRMMDRRRSAEFQASQAEARRVTQSISIKKPPMLRNLDTDSPMASPGSYGSSPPASPSLASPSPSMFKDKEKRWRSVFHPDGREISRSCSAKFENVPCNSPTVYDWVVISALDR